MSCFKFGFLVTALGLAACNPIDFQKFTQPSSPEVFNKDTLKGIDPDDSVDRLVNKTVQTQMNTSVDFSMALESGGDPAVSGLIATFDHNQYQGAVTGDFGKLELIDPLRFILRYTPALDYRGSIQHNIYLVNGNHKYSTSVVTLQVLTALNSLQPALAVRATGCITCHAQFHSNVVTDLGFNSSFAFGAPAFGTNGINFTSGSIYGDHGGSWSTSVLQKDVIVPQGMIPANTPGLGNASPMSIANYITSKLGANPNSRVIERQSIYIGAPTADRINTVSGFARHGRKLNYIADSYGDGANISEAFTYDEAQRTAIYNTGVILKCSGDLIVQGAVKLVNLQLDTKNGCRIYATESVFIQGAVSYAGDTSKANLQVVSARAIVMGLGENTCGSADPYIVNSGGANSLDNRLRIWTAPSHFQRDGISPTQSKANMLDDYSRVGTIREALCEPGGRAVAMNHVLLNAPQVHGRYSGDFTGSIISEIAIIALGNFKFTYDPVFDSVPVLPLLQSSDFLMVSDQ